MLESVRGQFCRRRTPDKKIGRLGELSALGAFSEVRVLRDVSMYIHLVLGASTEASGAKGLDGKKCHFFVSRTSTKINRHVGTFPVPFLIASDVPTRYNEDQTEKLTVPSLRRTATARGHGCSCKGQWCDAT